MPPTRPSSGDPERTAPHQALRWPRWPAPRATSPREQGSPAGQVQGACLQSAPPVSAEAALHVGLPRAERRHSLGRQQPGRGRQGALRPLTRDRHLCARESLSISHLGDSFLTQNRSGFRPSLVPFRSVCLSGPSNSFLPPWCLSATASPTRGHGQCRGPLLDCSARDPIKCSPRYCRAGVSGSG